MYVVENNRTKNEMSHLRNYSKAGTGFWTYGAAFDCSRPGNIVPDSTGTLHGFVLEPYNVTNNDSIGSLEQYWMTGAATGDIVNYEHETVTTNDGIHETVNIRLGAAIGADDRLLVGFGLGDVEHIWTRAPTATVWESYQVARLLYHFYYPFALVTTGGCHLLPVQDYPTNSRTLYQQIRHVWWRPGEAATNEMMVDLTGHPLASTRDKLCEQSDLYEDATGAIHAIWKEYTNRLNQWDATWKHGL